MWTISHTYCPYVICIPAILNSQKQQWTYSLFNVSKYSQTDGYWLMPWGMVRETPGRKGRGPFSSGAFCSMAWSWMWFCVSYNKYLHSFVRHTYSCQIAEHNYRTESGEMMCQMLSSLYFRYWHNSGSNYRSLNQPKLLSPIV